MNDTTIAIFEEYCDLVKKLPEGDSVEVTIRGKYFTELYTRVMLQGGVCISIMSDESDTHIATFVENGAFGMLDSLMNDDFDINEMFGDDFKDDESDWWKKQE